MGVDMLANSQTVSSLDCYYLIVIVVILQCVISLTYLKWYTEQTNYDIGKCQICYIHVCHGAHLSRCRHHPYYQSVANYCQQAYAAIEN